MFLRELRAQEAEKPEVERAGSLVWGLGLGFWEFRGLGFWV